MYYRLKPPWSFRGWSRLPYAVRAESGIHKRENPFFFDKETFLGLLYCNGEENVDINDLHENARKAINKMLEKDMLEQSEQPLPPLESWQRYKVFPSRYIKSVHWSITGKCNFSCRHCLMSAPDAHHPQLPLADCLRMIDEFAENGVNQVSITGGEPFVRKDFKEIVKALSEKDIDIAMIFTNASLLNENIIDILRSSGQHPAFQLSFDGLGHHDWLRGVNGAEKQADNAFRLLQKHKIPVVAAMCIHKGNKDSLHDTAKYLAELGVNTLRVNAPQSMGVWKQYSDEYALDDDELCRVYCGYIRDYFRDGMPLDIQLDGYFKCGKGKTDYRIPYAGHDPKDNNWEKYYYCGSMQHQVYISPDGKLMPCMGFADSPLKDRFTSILEKPLAEMTLDSYYHDVVNTRVSDLTAKNPGCAECDKLAVCMGGCMVDSMTDDGDFLVPEQRCCYFNKHSGAAVRKVADEAIKEFVQA